jgi:hypothetical protein
MSHEIIKGIKVENGKVTIKSCSNNVYPRIPRWQECPYLTRVLSEKGEKELEIELVRAYEEGNFQGHGTENKYSRAADRLCRMPEYAKFNWRCGGIGPEYEQITKNRETLKEEFNGMVVKALETKDQIQKCVVQLNSGYIYRVGRQSCSTIPDIDRAKVFNHVHKAEIVAGAFSNHVGKVVLL